MIRRRISRTRRTSRTSRTRRTVRVPLRSAALRAAVPALLAGLLTALAPPAAAQTAVRGGDVLYGSGGAACTVGFNAERGGQAYAVMLGHCVSAGGDVWYADPARTVQVGVTAGASFPGNDYAVVRYTNTAVSYPGEVKLGGGQVRDITGAANPVVGQSICHFGRVSGLHCGTVLAVNVTVNYPQGTVYGLFRSNACSEPGDAGGPAFSGGTALGIIVGGSGNCASGGTTFYQPVSEILSAYGLTLR